MSANKINDKKTINAWCMYDWANSVHALVITTAIFPGYFYAIAGDKGAEVDIFGMKVLSTFIYQLTLSLSFLLVSLLNPILSAIADYSGQKKKFMKFFCILGSTSCVGLFFLDVTSIKLNLLFFGFSGVGFAGSLVFYNAYLPEIVTEDRMDHVSAKGFTLGYIGSVLLLIVNLIMIMKPNLIGIPIDETGKAAEGYGTLAPKLSFLMTGIWWFGFAQITFRRLKDEKIKLTEKTNYIKKGFEELKKVWSESKKLPILKRFLIAFFFYSMGVQTVMYIATIFGEDVVRLEEAQLIILVLILQLVAIPGAFLFSAISKIKGNIFSLVIMMFIWILVCFAAFLLDEGTVVYFYILGAFVGLIMGGVQSMSRSTYAKMIPKDTKDTTSYFSFYETLEKMSIAIGTMGCAIVTQTTGDMHYIPLLLSVFFFIGLIILIKIPSKKIYSVKLADNNQ